LILEKEISGGGGYQAVLFEGREILFYVYGNSIILYRNPLYFGKRIYNSFIV